MSVDSASSTLVRNSFFLAPGQPEKKEKKKQVQTSVHISQNSQSTADFPVMERRAGLGLRGLGVRHITSVSSLEDLQVRCIHTC